MTGPKRTLAQRVLRLAGGVWCVFGVFVAASALSLRLDVARNAAFGAVAAVIGLILLLWYPRRHDRTALAVGFIALFLGLIFIAAAAIRVFSEGFAVFG
ncbi:hypothetical protein [Leucobacter chromiireducens]|uniref:Uncharacterized protein n=1 Tax=Leucobacter chromiireducens subsp. solipictus TaxID=398235 RepID=A0ABS1SHL7_9MICO|nr:hypothetical protein [Leucobacter chromiireducens]MBL3678768.1 hypothetical protein [Leucobacter chromiireducens subsp. solipictus]